MKKTKVLPVIVLGIMLTTITVSGESLKPNKALTSPEVTYRIMKSLSTPQETKKTTVHDRTQDLILMANTLNSLSKESMIEVDLENYENRELLDHKDIVDPYVKGSNIQAQLKLSKAIKDVKDVKQAELDRLEAERIEKERLEAERIAMLQAEADAEAERIRNAYRAPSSPSSPGKPSAPSAPSKPGNTAKAPVAAQGREAWMWQMIRSLPESVQRGLNGASLSNNVSANGVTQIGGKKIVAISNLTRMTITLATWTDDNTFRGSLFHEMGHIYGERSGLHDSAEWTQIFNEEWAGKGRYGSNNRWEAFGDTVKTIYAPGVNNPVSASAIPKSIAFVKRNIASGK